MGTEAPYLSGVFRFVARLHTLSKRGMRMALAGQPKCRYGMLQSLYNLIEQHGCDGAIYVSDIARQTHQLCRRFPAGCVRWSRPATSSARQTQGPPQDAGAHHPGRGARPQSQ